VSVKSAKIAAAVAHLHGGKWDPRYAGYFECFNSQRFYEAHDVLEDLWLADRHGPDGNYYKGLIQFAGAFVHLQKERMRPSKALFDLAATNLSKYPGTHLGLSVTGVISVIAEWVLKLESAGFEKNPLSTTTAPRIDLNEFC
jgi:predicted metal-dependent hydrolase